MNAEKCMECGLCKNSCPAYKALMKETASPRGKAILMKEGIKDKIFYMCTLCKACEKNCPLGLDLGLKEYREELIKNGVETEAGKKMIENIRKHGNPFGKTEQGKTPKDLYCC